MSQIEDFDLDENSINNLCSSAKTKVMAQINEVARLRRLRREYQERADKEQDSVQKSVLTHQADDCRERILRLMPMVSIYEKGRARAPGVYV